MFKKRRTDFQRQAVSRQTYKGGTRSLQAFLAPAILLLAAVLRFYRIAGQSLWNDEGTSVALAARDLAAITQGAALDIHPPFYYYLLHFWMLLFGNGEVAVRAPSALAGVLLVGVTFALGKRLFGRDAALLAAFLSAISPLQIHYSQETRMYALAALLGAVSVYLLVRLLDDLLDRPAARVWLWGLAWLAASTLGLYTHYFVATVLLAQNLAVGAILLGLAAAPERVGRSSPADGSPSLNRKWATILRLLRLWIPLQLIALLLYLPWLSVMQQQWANWPAVSQPFTLGELLVRVHGAFSLGLAVAPGEEGWALVLLAALLLAGIVAAIQVLKGHERRSPVSVLLTSSLPLLYLLTPIMTMYLLSLRRPLYNPKFLLVATPAFYLLLGLGWQRVADLASRLSGGRLLAPGGWQKAATALLAVAALSAVVRPLDNYYHNPRYARDDYRGIVRTIELSARPQDAILINAPGQIDIFDYYYKGGLPRYPLPRQRPLDREDTAQVLADILSKHGRIWAVLWGVTESDPQRFVESWLDAHAYKASDRWFGNVRLALYAVPVGSMAMQRRLDVVLGEGINLVGYSLAFDQAEAGDILQLALYWRVLAPISQRYKVFAHLLGPGDTLWGQWDSEPGGGLRLTTTWQVGELIQDNYGLPILPGTPPGRYWIEVGMYHLETGQRLPIRDGAGQPMGDRVLLGPVLVLRPAIPPAPGALGMDKQVELDLAPGLRLLGYSLIPYGGPDPAQAVLFWQARDALTRSFIFRLRLLDAGGREVWRRDTRPVEGAYPTTDWQPGEVVRDPHRLPLGLAPGNYRLQLAILEEGVAVAEGIFLELGRVIAP